MPERPSRLLASLPDEEQDGRLAADVELCAMLAAHRFEGPLWDHYADQLARFGCPVVESWLATGLIVKACRDQGRSVGLPSRWAPDDRRELALETVAKALEVFRISLMNGKWAPDKGASLRTYFLGGCARAFPNIVRAWMRDQQRWERANAVLTQGAEADPPRQPEAMAVVEARQALQALLGDRPKRVEAAHTLSFDGYTPSEIAEILGMTPAAVNALLHRNWVKARNAAKPQTGNSQ